MYAVVEIYGKQYRAEKGVNLTVDRFDAEKGSSVSFDKVLLVSGDSVKVGAPYVSGAAVKATVQDEIKADKVMIFKHKAKKDYRLTQGHRQKYTVIKVEDIVG